MTRTQRDFAWNFYMRELNMPVHKIRYLLTSGNGWEVLLGGFKGIYNSGVELTEELFDLFVGVLQVKLSDNPDIEYEFSPREWSGIERMKIFMKF